MAITSGPLLPYASVRLFDPGEGDPRFADEGFAWLDLLASNRRGNGQLGGAIERDSLGTALLELLPGVGLTNRPVMVAQDTLAAAYTTSGGSWQNVLLATGSPRKYRLHQYDGNADILWSASSLTALPADPNLAVTLQLPDTPPDWDAATYPPYVQVELGSAGDPGSAWAVRFQKSAAQLLYWTGTAWEAYADLPNPAKGGGYTDGEEITLWVRCVAGRILLSFDLGGSYETFGTDAAPLGIASGPLTVRGQGGACVFGVHQLLMVAGDYDSRVKDTLTSRIAPTVNLSGTGYAPAGTSLGYADLSATRYAQYRATLTPASTTWVGPGWAVYRAPVLHSVTYYIAPVMVLGTGSYTTPWDERILSVDIEKPEDLGQSTATIRIKRDAGSVWSGGYRRRKVLIELGYKQGSDPTVSWVAFIGYIRSVTPSRDGFGRTVVEIQVDNVTARLRKRGGWTELQVRSLAGFTVNEAGDYILTQFGVPLNSSYREWHAWGNLVTLADGGTDNPCELIRPGEDPRETLQRVMSYARLELAVTDDGIIQAVPYNFTTGATHDLRASPDVTLDLRGLADGISNCVDYDEMATRVLVAGEDAGGERLWAWAVDTEAETQTLSDRYCPWPELVQDEVPGGTAPGLLAGRAQLLAQQHFGLVYAVDSGVSLHDEASRRDSFFLYGFEAEGIPDGTEHILMAMRHRLEVRQDGGVTLETQLGLERF